MATLTLTEVLVALGVDPRGLTRGFAEAENRFDRLSSNLTSKGAALSLAISAPFTAGAAAATRASVTFDSTLTKTVTLASISEQQMRSWRESILAIGPAVGRGPTELAQAMLVVASQGVRGAEALDIVERSGRASAIGLGETAAVARAVTSAVQAYGPAVLSAGRATDILFAAVDQGAAEASELAPVLGRVVGLAAQVGVSFEQTAAFIATFTRLGIGADEAVTALRGTLSTVLKPSQQAGDALGSVGLSVEELRRRIREDGLAATLIDLVERFRGNEDALAAVIPNVRALAGVLGTAGVQATGFRQVLDAVTNSAGILDQRFERLAKTPGFAFDVFKARAEVAAIAVGDQLAPALVEVLDAAEPLLGAVVSLANGFAELPGPIQTTALAAGAALAVLGPLLLVAGPLVSAFGLLASAAAFAGWDVLIGGATSAAIALGYLTVRADAASDATAGVGEGAAGVGSAVQRQMALAQLSVSDLTTELEKAEKKLNDIRDEAAKPGLFSRFFTALKESFADEFPGFDELARRTSERAAKGAPRLTLPESPVKEAERQVKEVRQALQTAADREFAATQDDLFRTVENSFQGITIKPPLVETTPVKIPLVAEPEPAAISQAEALPAVFRELEQKLAGVDRAAALLGPSFDPAAEKASLITEALRQAADQGITPASAAAQGFAAQLRAAQADSTQLDRDLSTIQSRVSEPGFDPWRESISRVRQEMDRLRGEGFDETSPEIAHLRGQLNSLVAAGPNVSAELARMRIVADAIGPSFDYQARAAQFLTGTIEQLAQEGGTQAVPAIQALGAQLVAVSSDTSQLNAEMSRAAEIAALFGGRQEILKAELAVLEPRIRAMATALGATHAVVQGLVDRYAALQVQLDRSEGFDTAIENAKKLQAELAAIDERIAILGDAGGGKQKIDNIGVALGFGRVTSPEPERVSAKLQAARGAFAQAQALPPGPEREQTLIDLGGKIKGLEQVEAQMAVVSDIFDGVADSVTQAWDRSVLGVIQGTITLKQAVAQGFQSMALQASSEIVGITTKFIAEQGKQLAIFALTKAGILSVQVGTDRAIVASGQSASTETAAAWVRGAIITGLSWVITGTQMIAVFIATAARGVIEAVKLAYAWIAPAATAAASSVASIPYVGAVLALAAAAAVVGGLTALVVKLSGAEHGAVIEKDQPLFVHKGEMVLPRKLSTGIQDLVTSSGPTFAPGAAEDLKAISPFLRAPGAGRGVGLDVGRPSSERGIGRRDVQLRTAASAVDFSGVPPLQINGPLISAPISAVDSQDVHRHLKRHGSQYASSLADELSDLHERFAGGRLR
jgi:TP901 family phage tail tape measure protein